MGQYVLPSSDRRKAREAAAQRANRTATLTNIPPVPDPLAGTLSQQVAEGASQQAGDFGAGQSTADKIGEAFASLLHYIPGVGLSMRVGDEASKTPEQRLTELSISPTDSPIMPTHSVAMATPGGPPGIGHNGGPAMTRTMEHGISSNKLRRPLEEMSATHEPAPGPPLLPQKEFNLNDVPIGSTFVPLVGDRTLAGKLLTGVNETPFETPVHQQGGSDFTRGPQMQEEGAYWASHPGVITNMANRTRAAQESGDPVFAAHVAMGPQSGDFSLQTTDAILEQLKHAKLTPEAIAAFNKAMAEPWTKDFPGTITDFPGVDKLTREWSASTSADNRKKLAKLMDQGRFQKLGFPDIGSTRKAVTEPELLNAKTGDTGHNIVRVGPEAVQAITDPKLPHSDYASQLVRGSHEGTITGGVPWNEFWSDWFTARNKPGENPSHTGKAFSTQDVRQKVTQEWKDRMMKLAEFKKSDRGKKLGLAGAIGLGLITAKQAKEEFGYDDET